MLLQLKLILQSSLCEKGYSTFLAGISILYSKIKNISNANAKLHITLNNDVVYSISTISADLKVSFSAMTPSCFTVVGWCLSGWFSSYPTSSLESKKHLCLSNYDFLLH